MGFSKRFIKRADSVVEQSGVNRRQGVGLEVGYCFHVRCSYCILLHYINRRYLCLRLLFSTAVLLR